MALVIKDRVKETSTTTGTSNLNLAGAVSGFQSFVSGIGDTNTVYYALIDANGTAWEIGLGTVGDASPDTLSRADSDVIASTNSNNRINLSSGTHTVFATYPAGKAVYLDASGNLSHTVALTTDTSGNYVATITGGTGITSTGATSGEGIAHSLSVDASQTQITAIGTIATGTWEATDIAIAHGGTGASTASAARTNLGVAIGSDVQAYDADLATIAGLSSADGNFIVGSASGWVVESGATARTSLGVDAAGTDNSTNVTLVTTSHDYLSISGQAITLAQIDIGDDTNLTAGTGITLTGDTLSVDASQTQITAVGTIATGTWQGTAIAQAYIANDAINGDKIADDAVDSEHYAAGSIDEEHLNATNSPTDNYVLSYDDASGGFTWVSGGGGGEANQNAFSTISVASQDDVVADSTTDTLTLAAGSNVTITTTAASDTVTIAATDTNTQLSTEEVQDIAGPLVATGGTKTLITVTYDDTNGDMDFVVDNDLSNYDNSSSGFLTAHPNISAASSSDNSGRTYIQDITVDSNGHVTGIATATETVTDTNTQLSTEEVQDIAGPLVATGGTKTLISVTYDDTNGNMDFVVDNDLSNYSNSSSGFLTAHPSISAASSSDNSGRTYIQDITLDSNGHVTGIATATETVTDTNTQLSTEEVQDIAGGMFTGNTETLITATYQDADGTIDLVVDDDLSNYDNSSSGFLTAHPSISAASSSDNSGRTYIQDITLDSNGHVTGIATATETVTDTNTTYAKADFDLDHLFTLVGASADSDEHLGTFTGSTISDNQTIKAAIQALETAVETKGAGDITGVDLTGGTGISIDSETNTGSGAYSSTITCNLEGTELASTGETGTAKFLRVDGDGTCSWQVPPDTNTTYAKADFDLDHLFTLVGASADTDENLGTFTGSTISDSRTIKQALQDLETELETKTSNTGDITGVDLTGGTGISIDSETNTGSGAYSSTITCNLEGTELASTGETGTTKFLRVDGDGTCSWQVPPDTNTTYSGGTNLTLDGTTFNVDDAFLKNNADDTTSGTVTMANLIIGDGGNIGSASDTDAVAISAGGVVTLATALKTTLKSNTDASTVTFDLNVANTHTVTLGDNRTLAISNETAGQKFIINLVQDGTGSRTVTWFSTIKWAGGSAPTLTTTANKADSFGFLCTGTDAYYGFVIGQNI